MTCGAPLRNRTVGLLRTIYSYCIPSQQVRRLTSQNASTDQHRQARDRHSRARFATRFATQYGSPARRPPTRPTQPFTLGNLGDLVCSSAAATLVTAGAAHQAARQLRAAQAG